MTKLRIFIFLLTILVVGSLGIFVSFYARGYRFDTKSWGFIANGLLVVKSEPDGASIFVNGELATATNTTLSLRPGTYDLEIRKDGFLPWRKRLTVEKEVVTEASASLFRSTPSLAAVTFFGAGAPTASDDLARIAYAVAPAKDTPQDKVGLWLIETLNLPLGFAREPRRITDGDLASDASWVFSPDGREILLTIGKSAFLLDTAAFTGQKERLNVASRKEEILAEWARERKVKIERQLKNLPEEAAALLARKAKAVAFSPDESKVLYTASASARLSANLLKPLPGASTQKEERNITIDRTYVYDIKEDRNFLIQEQEVSVNSQQSTVNSSQRSTLRWFPTSRHLILSEEGKITIMDYDGTNRQTVYSGSYVPPHAYPFVNTSKLLILTDLGASIPNLYSLSLK